MKAYNKEEEAVHITAKESMREGGSGEKEAPKFGTGEIETGSPHLVRGETTGREGGWDAAGVRGKEEGAKETSKCGERHERERDDGDICGRGSLVWRRRWRALRGVYGKWGVGERAVWVGGRKVGRRATTLVFVETGKGGREPTTVVGRAGRASRSGAGRLTTVGATGFDGSAQVAFFVILQFTCCDKTVFKPHGPRLGSDLSKPSCFLS